MKGIWVDTPKTKHSRRNVPLQPKVIGILQKYKKNSGWVASTNKGNYISPRNYSRSFDMLLKQAGLPKIKLHALRHTFATLMVANGVDLKSVSQIIGHSQVAFTAQVYTHPDMETKQRSIAKIDTIMFE
jgi:integrase